MAIIKAVRQWDCLRRIISYVTQDAKTTGNLVSGWNVDPDHAAQQMMATKRAWHKSDGRQYKHFVQSFRAGETTPETAHEIAMALIAQCPMFADYEVLAATHTDRNHIHTHIIVNSVSHITGRKFRQSKHDLQDLKDLSDSILPTYGLSAESTDQTNVVTAWNQKLYQVLQHANEGSAESWVYETASAAADAMEKTGSDKEKFARVMERAGYHVSWKSRHALLTHPCGMSIRSTKLEEIFKLPSLLAKYSDPLQIQNVLAEDLFRAEKAIHPSVDSGETELPEIQDIELIRTEEWVNSGSRADQSFETAIAVQKSLHESASGEQFMAKMRESGYKVSWSETAKNVTFTTPAGMKIRSSKLEKIYGTSPIKDTIRKLDESQAAEPDAYSDVPGEIAGEICPIVIKRSDGCEKSWDEIMDGGIDQAVKNGDIRICDGAAAADGENQCLAVEMSGDDRETTAAAVMYGIAASGDLEQMRARMKGDGYHLTDDGHQMISPLGGRINIVQQASRPSISSVMYFIWHDLPDTIRCRYKRYRPIYLPHTRTYLRDDDLYVIVATAATIIYLMAELMIRLAELIMGRRSKDDGLYVRDERGEITPLDTYLKKAALSVTDDLYPAKQRSQYISGGQSDRIMRMNKEAATAMKDMPDGTAAKTAEQKDENAADKTAAMEQLLRDVRSAVHASQTRSEFEAFMQSKDYTLRWTQNGTLTFIRPDGIRIRASRLEKQYRLPSIAAAYGSAVRAPQKGPRPAAAQTMKHAMEISRSKGEFERQMESAGYQIMWRQSRTGDEDATITAPDGTAIRMSTLARQFGLAMPAEVYGIHIQEGRSRDRSEAGDCGSDSGGLEALRAAAARAEAAIATGRYGLRNRGSEQGDSRSSEQAERSGQAAGPVPQAGEDHYAAAVARAEAVLRNRQDGVRNRRSGQRTYEPEIERADVAIQNAETVIRDLEADHRAASLEEGMGEPKHPEQRDAAEAEERAETSRRRREAGEMER